MTYKFKHKPNNKQFDLKGKFDFNFPGVSFLGISCLVGGPWLAKSEVMISYHNIGSEMKNY